MSRTLRRTAAAMAAACSVLIAVATPAAATVTTLNAELAGGSVTLNPSGSIDVGEGGGGGEDPCATTALIEAEVDDAPTPGTVKVTDLFSRNVVDIFGSEYVVELSDRPTGAVAGQFSGSSPSVIGAGALTDMRVEVRASIWELEEDEEDPCLKGELVCAAAVRLNFTGTYAPDLVSPATGDTFSLSGVSVFPHVVADPTCNAGPSQVIGDTVSVTLDGTVL